MSGIYIPGMEMPTSCRDCPMGDSLCCGLMHGVPALSWKEYTNAIRTNRRHKDCPLIPVPEHGRLIDADALKKMHHWTDDFYEIEYVEVEDIDAAPTVIPEGG